jgi:hypothetical protein
MHDREIFAFLIRKAQFSEASHIDILRSTSAKIVVMHVEYYPSYIRGTVVPEIVRQSPSSVQHYTESLR